MIVRVTQLDGTLPNLALMRIAAWHRARGDEVAFMRSPYRQLGEPAYDRVYGSAIFRFSFRQIERLRAEWPTAIIGGTGTASGLTVEEIDGFEDSGLDYSLYPDFTASIGFTQRGCRLSCKFCVVPGKEGRPRAEASVARIWRGDPWPRHLHLLDNDFFGAPGWEDRIDEIRRGRFKVSFTQGINVRAMTEEVAAAIASIQYRDDGFRKRRLYTAWDNLKDEAVFFRGVDMLEAAGVSPRHVMAFMLVGFDRRETWDRIHHRFARMVDRGIRPYPMVFDCRATDPARYLVEVLYRVGAAAANGLAMRHVGPVLHMLEHHVVGPGRVPPSRGPGCRVELLEHTLLLGVDRPADALQVVQPAGGAELGDDDARHREFGELLHQANDGPVGPIRGHAAASSSSSLSERSSSASRPRNG